MVAHDETIKALQEADKEHDQLMTKFMQNLVSGKGRIDSLMAS